MKTSAKKVTRVWAEVEYNGWSYKVHPDGSCEEWRLSSDDGHGYWRWMDNSEKGYFEIKAAGLSVLNDEVSHE